MSQDDIDIEKLRVDPEFIQQMAGGPDGKSKRKGWRRNFTLVPREWELRLLGAKRVVTYKLGAELLYRHWLGGGKSIAVTNAVANAANLSPDQNRTRSPSSNVWASSRSIAACGDLRR